MRTYYADSKERPRPKAGPLQFGERILTLSVDFATLACQTIGTREQRRPKDRGETTGPRRSPGSAGGSGSRSRMTKETKHTRNDRRRSRWPPPRPTERR